MQRTKKYARIRNGAAGIAPDAADPVAFHIFDAAGFVSGQNGNHGVLSEPVASID
jgi:hypothetical protein